MSTITSHRVVEQFISKFHLNQYKKDPESVANPTQVVLDLPAIKIETALRHREEGRKLAPYVRKALEVWDREQAEIQMEQLRSLLEQYQAILDTEKLEAIVGAPDFNLPLMTLDQMFSWLVENDIIV